VSRAWSRIDPRPRRADGVVFDPDAASGRNASSRNAGDEFANHPRHRARCGRWLGPKAIFYARTRRFGGGDAAQTPRQMDRGWREHFLARHRARPIIGPGNRAGFLRQASGRARRDAARFRGDLPGRRVPYISGDDGAGALCASGLRAEVTVAYTNKVPTPPCAGGGPQAVSDGTADDDRRAKELGLDPAEIRRAIDFAIANALSGRADVSRRQAGVYDSGD